MKKIKSSTCVATFVLMSLFFLNGKVQASSDVDGCVSVPEKPSKTDGTKISICYKWLQPYDQNKKTFIFLVGGPGAGFEYYMLFSEFWLNTSLGKNYNLLFFDPRGVGHSSKFEATNDMHQITITNMTNDIESLRKNLLGDQAIGLIGHSTGGHQVFDYAIRFPEHVSKIISLNGGVSGLGFLTQVYYRFIEWQKAVALVEPQKLLFLKDLITKSKSACDSDGSKLLSTSWDQLTSFALYGTVSQRKMLPNLIGFLVQGNVDSQKFCETKISTQKVFPTLPSNDPLIAMSGINLEINTHVVCSSFVTKGAVDSLPVPFYEPTYKHIWSVQCLPLLTSSKIIEEQFDVRENISKIRVPMLIVGADSDQWIPFNVQNEIWQNLTNEQKANSEIHELNQCGHFSFYECPSQLKLILDHFLN